MRHAVDRRQQANLPILTRFDGDGVAVIDKLKQGLRLFLYLPFTLTMLI